MKKMFSFGFSFLLLISNVLVAFNNSNQVLAIEKNDDRVTPGIVLDETKDKIVRDLKAGRKVDFSRTLVKNNSEGVKGKYIIFVKKDKVKQVTRSLNATQLVVTKEYGEVTPVPVQFEEGVNIDNELAKLAANPDVLGVSQVVKRKPFSISVPNDPKYPNGDYSNTKQWYLNPPSGSNYGIDVLNAWNYLDSQGKAWNGASDITVAVIDTGVAYENFSKYGSYNLMNSPTAWDFTRSPDGTDNVFVNTNETADNQTDDDNNGFVSDTLNTVFNQPYCLDANSNGQCDSPSERTKSYIDDRNGFDLTDFNNYWYPYGVNAASNCSNAPYTTYKCVPQRYCNRTGQPNYYYVGCYGSDMGHPNDMMGHGTVVANIIAQKVNNSLAGSGIASGVKILPIRIFGYQYFGGEWELSGGDSLSTALSVQYAIDRGAKIVNMSFGGPQSDPFEELVMDSAYNNHNMLLVAASGNSGNDVPQYPAAYDSVMAVGAANKNGTKSSYSTYGSFIELVAPVDNGIPVESYACYFNDSCMGNNPNPNNPSQFSTFDSSSLTAGTSFAAPQVSAVAALVWTARPSMTASQVRHVLNMSAVPITSRFNTLMGYGILNAHNAVRGVNSDGRDITQKNILIETTRNSAGKVATRYSFDGADSWSEWEESMSTSDEVATIYNVNGNHAVQAIRDGSKLYVRNGSVQNSVLVWNGWVKLGSTLSAPKLVNAEGRVVLSMRGTDNSVYTRYSDDWGSNWSGWIRNGASTTPINMIYYLSMNRILQSMRGTDGKVYTRYSNDKAGSWSSWTYAGIKSTGEVTLTLADTYIDQTVRGTDGYVNVRYSKDGGGTWSSWYRNGYTTGDISSEYVGGDRVVQFMRNGTKSYIRFSPTKGRQWGAWNYFAYTESNPTIFFDNKFNRLMLALKVGSSVYTRYSGDGGTFWTGWQGNGSTLTDINFGNGVYENW